jgi:hypothetical protein
VFKQALIPAIKFAYACKVHDIRSIRNVYGFVIDFGNQNFVLNGILSVLEDLLLFPN